MHTLQNRAIDTFSVLYCFSRQIFGGSAYARNACVCYAQKLYCNIKSSRIYRRVHAECIIYIYIYTDIINILYPAIALTRPLTAATILQQLFEALMCASLLPSPPPHTHTHTYPHTY